MNLQITEAAVLLRISQLYRAGMSDAELYEAARGFWRMGPQRLKVLYALAVYGGVVREVYEVVTWHRAGTTAYATRDASKPGDGKRWEFTGGIAPDQIRSKYLDGAVGHYFKRGAVNPFSYVGAAQVRR